MQSHKYHAQKKNIQWRPYLLIYIELSVIKSVGYAILFEIFTAFVCFCVGFCYHDCVCVLCIRCRWTNKQASNVQTPMIKRYTHTKQLSNPRYHYETLTTRMTITTKATTTTTTIRPSQLEWKKEHSQTNGGKKKKDQKKNARKCNHP